MENERKDAWEKRRNKKHAQPGSLECARVLSPSLATRWHPLNFLSPSTYEGPGGGCWEEGEKSKHSPNQEQNNVPFWISSKELKCLKENEKFFSNLKLMLKSIHFGLKKEKKKSSFPLEVGVWKADYQFRGELEQLTWQTS